LVCDALDRLFFEFFFARDDAQDSREHYNGAKNHRQGEASMDVRRIAQSVVVLFQNTRLGGDDDLFIEVLAAEELWS
jgi:hypothetical protein